MLSLNIKKKIMDKTYTRVEPKQAGNYVVRITVESDGNYKKQS